MTLRGTWVPENDTEEELLYAVLDLAKAAHDEGVPPERIAGLCGFAMLSILNEAQSTETSPNPSQRLSDGADGPADDEVIASEPCPKCGDEITGVILNLGGTAHIEHADGDHCEGIDTDEHPIIMEIWKQDRHGP